MHQHVGCMAKSSTVVGDVSDLSESGLENTRTANKVLDDDGTVVVTGAAVFVALDAR